VFRKSAVTHFRIFWLNLLTLTFDNTFKFHRLSMFLQRQTPQK